MSAVPVARGQHDAGRVPAWVISTAFMSTVVVVWQVLAVTGTLPDYILSPTAILAGVSDYAASGDMWPATIASLRRATLGFVIGAGGGVLLGLAAGTFRGLGDLVELPLAFTYPLPKIALFPVLAVLLGFTDTTRVIVIALACFYPTFLNSQSGTRTVDPIMLQLARNVEATRWQTFRQVIAPAALPRTLAGVRIAVGLSFILVFATEIIGFSNGVGSEAWRAYGRGNYPRMYAAITVLAASGFIAYQVFNAVSRRLMARRSGGDS